MAVKKEKSSKNLSGIFNRWLVSGSVAYCLGLIAFPLLRPNDLVDSPQYHSFIWSWLQLYYAIFLLIEVKNSKLFK